VKAGHPVIVDNLVVTGSPAFEPLKKSPEGEIVTVCQMSRRRGVASCALAQPKSDLSDFGQLKR
jgi:hypothetical protein